MTYQINTASGLAHSLSVINIQPYHCIRGRLTLAPTPEPGTTKYTVAFHSTGSNILTVIKSIAH